MKEDELRNDLVDIRNIKINQELPVDEKVKSYIEQIKNPYHFCVGKVKVRISFSNTDITLSDSFSNIVSNG